MVFRRFLALGKGISEHLRFWGVRKLAARVFGNVKGIKELIRFYEIS